MTSVGKPILILGAIALVVTGAFFSASPVLAENSAEHGGISSGIIEAQDSEPILMEAEALGEAATDSSISQPAAAGNDQGKVRQNEEQIRDALDRSEMENEAIAFTEDESETLLRFSDIAANVAALQNFVDSVSNGSGVVTGIYINEYFSLKVGQQPSGSPGHITSNAGEVTQFGLAADYGSKGFLAHNYLSGDSFFDLEIGMKLSLVYGDGSIKNFVIEDIRSFEALQPNSPTSTFVDLDQGGKLSAADLFYSIYNSNNPFVLQTCIANHGVSTWGRVFIIAVPVAS